MGGKAVLGVDEVKSFEDLGKCLLAEFLGTMLLVLVGCGSCIAWGSEAPSVLQIAIAFGFIIAAMVQSVGHISGCHINPAVTLGLFIMGRIGLLKAVLYVPAQCAGAVAGAALLKYMVPDPLVKTLGATVVNNVITPGQGVAVEATITAVLLLVVGAVTDPDRNDLANAAPIAIGIAITCCHIFAVPITGSSMNPARALGPAAIQSVWDHHWVYWVGPLLGAAVAGAVYRLVFKAPKDENSYDL
ncbi:aquaporin homolog protein drip isoform X2 [Rhodnius prolixus]|uniref:Aquaporin 1 variant A n=2 Tax=Rhodnius TaxID=13248 RepID=K9KZP8_RHOPR|nr:aquaporin 1 variant A [Rhodnius prolixus]